MRSTISCDLAELVWPCLSCILLRGDWLVTCLLYRLCPVRRKIRDLFPSLFVKFPFACFFYIFTCYEENAIIAAAIAAPPNMSSTQRVITANNKSPLVQVLSLMFLVIAILSCLVRTGTKLYMIKTLRVDDILIIVATVRHACLSHTRRFTYACTHRSLQLVRQPPSSMHVSMDSANTSKF